MNTDMNMDIDMTLDMYNEMNMDMGTDKGTGTGTTLLVHPRPSRFLKILFGFLSWTPPPLFPFAAFRLTVYLPLTYSQR